MSKKIAARRKLLMAVGLMVIFLPLGVYVNSDDRSWSAISARIFPDFAVQFVVSTLITYGWVSLAEWMQRYLRPLSARFPSIKLFWLHLLMGTAFFVVSMAAIAAMLLGTEWFFYQVMKMPYPVEDISHAERAIYGQFATLSLCVYTLIANRHNVEMMEEVRLRTEQLEKENLLSQFTALKNQVNPHFLFNSLSILTSLVKTNPKLSEQFIDRLSKAYRYILELRDSDLVPMSRELEFLQSYTFLLQTRFEEKFEVRVLLGKKLIQTSAIPPLTLQLLVENAVKHNRMSENEPLLITIEQEGDMIVVRNNLRPRETQAGSTGVGLQNIINRYALLTDRPVWAGETEDEFIVKVPLLT